MSSKWDHPECYFFKPSKSVLKLRERAKKILSQQELKRLDEISAEIKEKIVIKTDKLDKVQEWFLRHHQEDLTPKWVWNELADILNESSIESDSKRMEVK